MYVTNLFVDNLLMQQIISYFEHTYMLLERISDGAFFTAKLDFFYRNWEFAYELFANLTS